MEKKNNSAKFTFDNKYKKWKGEKKKSSEIVTGRTGHNSIRI